MNLADLIPAVRRVMRPGETPPAAPVEPAAGAPAAACFADVLAVSAILPVAEPAPDGVANAPEAAAPAEATPVPAAEAVSAEAAPAAPDDAAPPAVGTAPATQAAVSEHPSPLPRVEAQAPPAAAAKVPAVASAAPAPAERPAGVPEVAEGESDADAAGPQPRELPSARAPATMPSAGSAPPGASPAPMLVAAEPGQAPAWKMERAEPNAIPAKAAAVALAAAPPPVVQQIAAAVAQGNAGQFEVRLDPPELGRVQIWLEPGEEGLRAVVLAERAETQDLLRRNADQLARDLGTAGYPRVTLDFATGQEAPPRGDRPGLALGLATAAAPDTPEQAPPPLRSLAGGLDIRI